MKEVKKKKAIIYCRVSSQRQKDDGSGLNSQEHRCREYCKSQDYEVVEVFKDSFTGGGDFMLRPAMRSLLEYLDQRNPEPGQYIVVFDDLKRFARDVEFHIKLRSAFKARHVERYCLNFPFEDSPMGNFGEGIMALTAQLEREQNRIQVLQKMRARLEAGYWSFSSKTYGYEFKLKRGQGKVLVIKPNEAQYVKQALEQFASGALKTQADVRDYLQKRKIQSKKNLSPDTVKHMLANPLYAGYLEYKPWGISWRKAVHEPLITLSTFQRIQERLKERSPIRTRKDMRADFPLRGFVACSACGKSVTASFTTNKIGKRIPYYRCGRKGCSLSSKSLPALKLHERFEKILAKFNLKDELLGYLLALIESKFNAKLQDQKLEDKRRGKELEKLEKQIATLVERLASTDKASLVAIYEEQIEELSKKKVKISDTEIANGTPDFDLKKATTRVFDFLRKPLDTWRNGSLRVRHALLKILFDDLIPYDRDLGFGTPKKRCNTTASRWFGANSSLRVLPNGESWNTFYEFLERTDGIIRNIEQGSKANSRDPID